jgi:hypothetical protein
LRLGSLAVEMARSEAVGAQAPRHLLLLREP